MNANKTPVVFYQCCECEEMLLDNVIEVEGNIYCSACFEEFSCDECGLCVPEIQRSRMWMRDANRGFMCEDCYESNTEECVKCITGYVCLERLDRRDEDRGCICDICFKEAQEEEEASMREDDVFERMMQEHVNEVMEEDDSVWV
jgi:hypothetical protein